MYFNSRQNFFPNLHLENELQKPNKLLTMNRNQGAYSQVSLFPLNSQLASWISRNTQNYRQCPLVPLMRYWRDAIEDMHLFLEVSFPLSLSRTDSHLLRKIYTICAFYVSFFFNTRMSDFTISNKCELFLSTAPLVLAKEMNLNLKHKHISKNTEILHLVFICFFLSL